MGQLLLISIWGLLSFHVAFAETVEFRIPMGTGDKSWNSPEKPVEARLGDTLRIINDDSVDHQLHITAGAPCAHGDNMKPGESWECVIKKEYNFETDFKMYDHHRGESARFYFRTIN